MEPIILASASPRRQEILKNLGIPFTIVHDYTKEENDLSITPAELAESIAIKKVKNAAKITAGQNVPWILGADTLISANGEVFGKPDNRDEAYKMISSFSGKTHQVITSLALFSNTTHLLTTRISQNDVTFITMTNQQIEQYLDTGEWQGVAGGYRIQGLASYFISKISGTYSSIMGLPINDFYDILSEQGYEFF